MNKIIVFLVCFTIIGGVCFLTVGSASSTIREPIAWSNPEITPYHAQDNRIECDRTEWDSNFENYRAGNISKESMINYVKGCKW